MLLSNSKVEIVFEKYSIVIISILFGLCKESFSTEFREISVQWSEY